MPYLRNRPTVARRRLGEQGFTLVELLVTMVITTVILGATMAAMTDVIKATEAARQITDMNNGLRTAMDLMVRDLLQVGQGLPGGRAIQVPNGGATVPMQLPGPPGSNFQLDGPSFCSPRDTDPDTVCEEITAVVPGPGRGPVIVADQPASDMITTVAADSAFDAVPLVAFAANGRSITVALPCSPPPVAPALCAATTAVGGRTISDNPDVGSDNIRPGDLIMLTKGASSALVQVSTVVGQVVNFAANDSLNLNQNLAVATTDGSAAELRATAPVDVLAVPPAGPCAPAPVPLCRVVSTLATRIRMITYYIDNVTDPRRPRLVRRINNGAWDDFDNSGGTVVAFDIEGLQFTYDLVDGETNPSNVRMDDTDLDAEDDGVGACDPLPCFANQIRKVNVMLSARSRLPRRGTQQFYRNRLVTQVSLRSLAFVDKYR